METSPLLGILFLAGIVFFYGGSAFLILTKKGKAITSRIPSWILWGLAILISMGFVTILMNPMGFQPSIAGWIMIIFVPICISPVVIMAWGVRQALKQTEQKVLQEVQQLIDNLDDPDQCQEAASQLEKIGRLAVEPLLKSYRPKLGKGKLLAISILGRIKDPRAIGDLINNLERGGKEPDVRLALVEALGQFEDERIISIMLKTLNDNTESVSVHQSAQVVLEKYDPEKVEKVREKYIEQQKLAERKAIEAERSKQEKEEKDREARKEQLIEEKSRAGLLKYLFIECEATQNTPGAFQALEKVTQAVHDEHKSHFANDIQMKASLGVHIPSQDRDSVETFVRMRQLDRGLPLLAFDFEFRQTDGFTFFVTYMKSE